MKAPYQAPQRGNRVMEGYHPYAPPQGHHGPHPGAHHGPPQFPPHHQYPPHQYAPQHPPQYPQHQYPPQMPPPHMGGPPGPYHPRPSYPPLMSHPGPGYPPRDPRDIRSNPYFRDPRDVRNLRDVRDVRDIRDVRDVRDFHPPREFRDGPPPRREPPRANFTKVFVGNIPPDVDWRDLKDHMRNANGDVIKADVLRDAEGKSKLCGIVEFSNPRDALEACRILTDSMLRGFKIYVREYKEDTRDFHGHDNRHDRHDKFNHGNERHVPGKRSGSSYSSNGRTIVIENLPESISWQDLKDQLRPIGAIGRTDIVTLDSGKSAGVGVAEFDNAKDAEKAIELLYNSEIQGNIVRARFWTRTDSLLELKILASGRRVYVNNLPSSVSWQMLKDILRPAGNVVRADVMFDSEGRSRGFGYVEFSTVEEADIAIDKFNNYEYEGNNLVVRKDKGFSEPNNAQDAN